MFSSGLPLAQADGLHGLVQLLLLIFFLLGPLIARALRALLEKAGVEEEGKRAREGRAESTRRPRSEAEDRGRDIWRQLMELDEDPDAADRGGMGPDATGPDTKERPAAKRRPQDPLHDPDVERVEDDALRRRRRATVAPVEPPPVVAAPPQPAPAKPAARKPAAQKPAPSKPTPRPRPQPVSTFDPLETSLSRVPSEEAMERTNADARPRQPLANLGGHGLGERRLGGALGTAQRGSLAGLGDTDLGRSAAAATVGRSSRRSPLGRPTRDELRRAVLWSEVLGAPVSMRDSGCGGRGPTQS